MNVIILKDSGDFFFDEPIEVARCPICESSVHYNPFQRIHDRRSAWDFDCGMGYIIKKSMECPDCGHHLSVAIPASRMTIPKGWEVVRV